MHKELRPYWDRSESLKVGLLVRVARLPEEARHRAAKAGDWSPLQVVSHLLIAERFVLGYRGTEAAATARPANPLVIGLLCRVLRAGIPLPAPDVMAPDPHPDSLDALSTQWQSERADFYQSLDMASPEEPFGLHPYFGIVTARQVMDMLEAHLLYHTKRFPKNAG